MSADHANEPWQEIQRAVESLSTLAKEEVSSDHFYGELVDCLCQLTSASHCAVWVRETPPSDPADHRSPANDPTQAKATAAGWSRLKEARHHRPDLRSHRENRDELLYARMIAEAAEAATETSLGAGHSLDGKAGVRLQHDTILSRVMIDGDVVVVIELAHEADRSPSQREGARHLSTVAVEIASEFERNWQLRQLRDREQRREKLDRFLDDVHRTYDLRHVAYAVVARGKELIECDRLSLVLKKGRRCHVVAVSGVQQPDRRSPTVRCIERLVKSKIRVTEPQWHEQAEEETKASILTSYFAESNAKSVGLLPIFSAQETNRRTERIGTLLVEMFDEQEISSNGLLKSRAQWLARHASNAIGNAVRINRLPMLGISRWIDRNVTRGKRLPWGALLAAALAMCIWFVAWLPTDFQIEARGELVPVKRESIYAPRSGTVIGFPKIGDATGGHEDAQGARVEPGHVVVRLENSELDYELTTLLGEQATVDQQLETIAVSLGQSGRARDAESRNRYDTLTAQAAELRVKQASLARRIRLVNAEREKLSIKASIHGRILTWDVVNALMLRPVQQGDLLLEVADVDGPWELDLYVRDRHIGYVKKAQQESSIPLSISFFLRSDPEREYTAAIKSVAMSTEVYPEYGSAVRVIGEIDGQKQLDALRPGTTIIARVDCGKKPFAYVLGYDLLHTIRMWMLF